VDSLKGGFLGEGRADERDGHEQGGKLFHGGISWNSKSG
jgi:hypothetical protein